MFGFVGDVWRLRRLPNTYGCAGVSACVSVKVSCSYPVVSAPAQVGLPYVQAKLDALYSRYRTRVDGVLGLGLARLQRQASPPVQPGDAVRGTAPPCMCAHVCNTSSWWSE